MDATMYRGDDLGFSWGSIGSAVQKIGNVAQAGAAIASGVAKSVTDVKSAVTGTGFSWGNITPGVVAAVAQNTADNIKTAAGQQIQQNQQSVARDSAIAASAWRITPTTAIVAGAAVVGLALVLSARRGSR